MQTDRSKMTVRLVPLHSREAGEARVGGTAAERLALVIRLSEASWKRTGQPFPEYTRETMPVAISRLGARSDRD